MITQTHRHALLSGYELHWFRIEQVLGQGAFGITYLAHDVNLDRQIAIKEYMPSQLSTRDEDLSVHPLSVEHADDFKWGLERFISEARTLTKFEHPNLVRVYNVFEANNTAYMVMNYEVGKSLKEMLRGRRTLNESELTRIMLPLMSGLELMHKKGFIHRDIKPGNIFIRMDGSPVLLDFGSARQTRGRDEPQTLTNFVSPGYAPIEQYASKSDRQGPWTDIYGLGATLYKAMTGNMPVAAIDRGETLVNDLEDEFQGVTKLLAGKYSSTFLKAVDHALAFKAQDRPQSMSEWRAEFDIESEDTEILPANSAAAQHAYEATIKMEIPSAGHGYETTAKYEKTAQMSELPTEAVTVTRESETAIIDIASGGAEAGETGKDSDTLALTSVMTASVTSSVPGQSRQLLLITGITIVSVILFAVTADLINQDTSDKRKITGAEVVQESMSVPRQETVATPPVYREPKIETVIPTPEADASTASSATPQPAETTNVTESKPAVKVAVAKPAKPAKPTRKQRIARLLSEADSDLKAMKLTKPVDDNAYDKYKQVLSMDRNNSRAKQGIRTVADKYVQLAYASMDANNLTRARYYLKKATEVLPGAQNTINARIALQEKVEGRPGTKQQVAQTATPEVSTPPVTAAPAPAGSKTTVPVEEPAGEQVDVLKEIKTWINETTGWIKDNSTEPDAGGEDKDSTERVKKVLGGS